MASKPPTRVSGMIAIANRGTATKFANGDTGASTPKLSAVTGNRPTNTRHCAVPTVATRARHPAGGLGAEREGAQHIGRAKLRRVRNLPGAQVDAQVSKVLEPCGRAICA